MLGIYTYFLLFDFFKSKPLGKFRNIFFQPKNASVQNVLKPRRYLVSIALIETYEKKKDYLELFVFFFLTSYTIRIPVLFDRYVTFLESPCYGAFFSSNFIVFFLILMSFSCHDASVQWNACSVCKA